MNRTLLIWLILLAAAIPTRPHENSDLTPQYDSTNQVYSLSWYGENGKNYRIQRSTDLGTWIYLTGSDLVIGLGRAESVMIPSSETTRRFFLRLEVEIDLHRTDSDGDGLYDYDEINVYHTDPYNADTNGDGVPDDQQVYLEDPNFPGDPTHNQANNPDTDGDGVPNSEDAYPLDKYRSGNLTVIRYVGIPTESLPGINRAVSDIILADDDTLAILYGDTDRAYVSRWKNGSVLESGSFPVLVADPPSNPPPEGRYVILTYHARSRAVTDAGLVAGIFDQNAHFVDGDLEWYTNYDIDLFGWSTGAPAPAPSADARNRYNIWEQQDRGIGFLGLTSGGIVYRFDQFEDSYDFVPDVYKAWLVGGGPLSRLSRSA